MKTEIMASLYLEYHNNPLTLTHIEQHPNKNKTKFFDNLMPT